MNIYENTAEENSILQRTYNTNHNQHKEINLKQNHNQHKEINLKENTVPEKISYYRELLISITNKYIKMRPQSLIDKPWQPITTGKPPRNIPGIYLIGMKYYYMFVPLYLGRSNDIRRRLNQHRQLSSKFKQRIDNFIQNQDKETITVKWICDVDQKTTEGMYLNYVEKYYGYKHKYNMKAGDGATRSTSMMRGCYFRQRITIRADLRPFPSQQRRIIARKTVSMRDVQIARKIRGIINNIN